MMKKSRSLIKVVACLAASFTILVGNPLMAGASQFKFEEYQRTQNCRSGHHYQAVVTVIPGRNCKEKAVVVFKCSNCGCEIGRKEGGYGPHCYPTNPYEAPICIYCGHRR